MTPWIPRLAVLAVLAGVPLVQDNSYWLHVFSLALISAVVALGLQLLVGVAGLLSLAQGAFYGIGAYAAGVLAVSLGLPFPLALLASGLIAAAASLLLVPIVKLKGSSLAVATLGFSIMVYLVILNEEWLTGGSMGLMGIPHPTLFGWDISGDRTFYWFCLVFLAVAYAGLHRITTSRFGRALVAISQDEEAARASGIAIALCKSKCFVIAAFMAGVAGALYAYHSRYLSPNDFSFNRSIEILIMVVVGGLGSLPGAVLGAFIVVLTPEFLRSSGEFRMILFGLAVVVLMGAGNRGLIGLLAVLVAWIPGRLRSARAEAVAPKAAE